MKVQLITLSMMASVALIHAAPATDPATAIAAAGSATNSGDFSWFYDLFGQGPKITASSPNGGDAATQLAPISEPATDPIPDAEPDAEPAAVTAAEPQPVPASPIDPSQFQGQITDTVGGLFSGIAKRQESTHRYQVDDVLRKTPISGHEGGDPVSEVISGLAGKSIGEVSSALKQKRALPTDALPTDVLSPDALLALIGAAGAAGGSKSPLPI
ncbi:hypothetical protein BJ944DRAFT_274080 [Cunninghamella echinulata]|nr:hypothetical protein BJ944DRAFT_274080 [Cunninghamella echinulata]